MAYLLVLLLLAGCNPFGAFKPTTDEILTSNWAPNPENKNKKPIKPLYGYRTLGETMYYSVPLENSENRMVGKTPDRNEKNQLSPYFEEWIPYPMR